ncbi:MAG: response regulator [Planctomycetes bacterium]|nr:response regulator [Planctomycetota bacterium]
MKIRHRLYLMVLGSTLVLAAAVLVTGAVSINSILYRIKYDILTDKLAQVMDYIAVRGSLVDEESHPAQVEEIKKRVLDHIASHGYLENSGFAIIDEHGSVLLSNEENRGELSTAYQKVLGASHPSGSINYSVAGSERVLLYGKTIWGWTIMLSATEEELHSEQKEYLFNVLTIFLIVFAFVVIFLYSVSHGIDTRMEETLELFRRVGDGDFSVRFASSDPASEMVLINNSINSMVEELERRKKQGDETHERLVRMQSELELMVEERTRQLQEANRQLSQEIVDREKAESELRDQRSFQAVLATIRAVSIEGSEEELWSAFLNSLVVSYRLCMAWFGSYKGGIVRPAYWAGRTDKYLAELEIKVEEPDTPDNRCAMCLAILENRPFGYQDLANDEGYGKWRDYALKMNYRSCLAIPLTVGNEIEGGVMVYSKNPAAFANERIFLLEMLVYEVGNRILESRRHQLAEEALIRTERMAAVGTLAGGVAHEFNNLNVGILGFAELSLLREDLDEDLRHALEHIRRAAIRARDITGSLLTFSGRRKATISSANLVDVVRESLSLINRELDNEQIDLELRLRAVPDTIMDPSQISQVILNLLINARHALLEKTDKRITIETDADSSSVWVEVSDNGCGIPPDDLGKIFTPFYSTKGEHSRGKTPQSKVKGTGLGLSISHTIIENHNGKIEAESVEGEGTSFRVSLPLMEGARSAPEKSPEVKTAEPVKGANIVVIDDEPDTRDLLRIMLGRQNYNVFDTDSGHEALSYIKNRNGEVDLVIVDVQMAAMTGHEFVAALQEVDSIDLPQIIVITGRPMSGEKDEIHGKDVFDIIMKPFEIEALSRQIRAAIIKRKELMNAL